MATMSCKDRLCDGTRLLIVSCSARKSDAYYCRALDRYNSPAFFVLRRYLNQNPESGLVVWIVSAKFGLIGSSRKVITYDLAMTAERAKILKRKFRSQFQNLYKFAFGGHRPGEVFCHLPQNYRTAIAEQLESLQKLAPLKFADGRPGEKLRELKNWLENKQEEINEK